MRTDRQVIVELEDEVTRLNAMSRMLGILLNGDISKIAKGGVVEVAEDEAYSIFWIGHELRTQIERLDNVFYGTTQEGKANATA
ncbi:hypothetical protein SAMN06265338_1309 [Rhodoblastus acidophilus]|uniref:Uncharacterized protein n=1 Tax=Rhodoblastus acidophilus TaxID=1074 RepID=A0A212SE22_RHOAC|nr:hypothetical protein [Rhodoblastus acidophilus]MCW2316767.1 hypothetical protein [Rhodoblastus acidophilus]PPQ34966.1 hypothetical protein CKO16_21385 [Rhodoblastus acidophilus]RAI16810.1 hypothetical protein CH337_19425 [Rhodoblastus acidophilus]SNB83792.1 hypothetical protein SAMN06265338_1309 [Rhodoblastus acidophilus]